MRVSISKTKNSTNIYNIKSTTINSKRTSIVVEKLGNIEVV